MRTGTAYLFWLLLISTCFIDEVATAQLLTEKNNFTRQDSLRGSNGPGRMRWNVTHYDISVVPDFNSKTIAGRNVIRFIDSGVAIMQLDIQEPMQLDSISNGSINLPFRREGNIYWVAYRDSNARYKIKIGERTLTAWFHGRPTEATRPPWDGGWIWKKDSLNNPWMSVACQGLGASVWYPCKDYQGDEPDSGAVLRMTVPDSLVAVGNGRLVEKTPLNNGTTRYSWAVKNPINNYNIIPYIGKYVHFSETFGGLKGKLDMDYWVLDYNLEKAKIQFKDAPKMMKAFEYWFGPFPFYEDGYKLVDAPMFGMEHQGAIAYGNGYRNGYNNPYAQGRNLSGTTVDKLWDFIIIHESGHEWFANSITAEELADNWIHESFTSYSETLFIEYYYGKDAANGYVTGTRKNIKNQSTIIGKYGVNEEGSGDMYYKGANMIHTIRQLINNDKKFRRILQGLNSTFYHSIVTSAQIENYISTRSGKKLGPVFDQYLRTTKIPVLEYKMKDGGIAYRWTNVVPGFDMPLRVSAGPGKKYKWIYPTESWKDLAGHFDAGSLTIDVNFFVKSKPVE